MATAVVKDVTAAGQEIDALAAKALKALEIFKTFNQEQVDKIIDAMTKAGDDTVERGMAGNNDCSQIAVFGPQIIHNLQAII